MIIVEHKKYSVEEIDKIIGNGFSEYALKNEIICNYRPFVFVAKEENEVVGIITGHSFYKEVCISELIVSEQYRGKRIGSKLLEAVENFYKDKNMEHINLATYHFQAPDFYKKCGFQLEYIRKNKENSKLDKYFFTKYF